MHYSVKLHELLAILMVRVSAAMNLGYFHLLREALIKLSHRRFHEPLA